MAAQLLAGKGFSKVYNLSGGINAWQSEVAVGDQTEGLALFSGEESVEAALMVAYGLEVGLRDFYLSMTRKPYDAPVRALFTELAEIEIKHQEQLLAAYADITGKSADRKRFDAAVTGHVEGGLTTEEFLARFSSDISSTIDVLSMAMAIEAQALDLYQRAADTAASADNKAVFRQIANEEKAHLRRLGDLMDAQV